MEKKTILILANNDIGLYKFRKALLQRLISDGYRVVAAAPAGDYMQPLVELGCETIDTPMDRRGINPVKDLHLFLRYWKMMGKVKPDLVVTYTIKPNVYGGFASRVKDIECVNNITGLGTAIEQGGVLSQIVLIMYRAALKKAKVVFFENMGNRDELVQYGVIEEERTCVLHGAGVDAEEFAFSPYPMDGPVRFLYIGRIMREKGIDELLSAATRLKECYGDRVQCELVGYLEDSYEAKLNEMQNKGIICYSGFQDDVLPIYQRAHCIVLPSYHEGMSNVLLEAASIGRPLITSNIPGCMEAVEEGKNGYLCQVRDSESLYQAMERFVRLPYEKRKEMGIASRNIILESFEKGKVVEQTVGEIYRRNKP